MPRVSIILPVRNHRAFIEERVQSIIQQSFTDWDCIVVDGESTDGTWEYLLGTLGSDSRFRLLQRPPRGVYDAWNIGIAEATGDFVYIATSDDTMYSNCLAAFSSALDAQPQADIALCKLDIIDSEGRLVDPNPWYRYLPQQFYADRLSVHHLRLAPIDGILHAYLFTLYTSITQLFIRRRVFEQEGYFSTSFGPKADFEWAMRVSLIVNLVYVPQALATWRIHDQQLTVHSTAHTAELYKELIRMVTSAVERQAPKLKHLPKSLISDISLFYRSRLVESMLVSEKNKLQRYFTILKLLCKDRHAVSYYYTNRGKDALDLSKNALLMYNLHKAS